MGSAAHPPTQALLNMRMSVGGCQLRSDADMQTATLWFSSHPCIELGEGKGEGVELQMCSTHAQQGDFSLLLCRPSLSPSPSSSPWCGCIGRGSLERGLCVGRAGILQPSHLSSRAVPGEGGREGRGWAGVAVAEKGQYVCVCTPTPCRSLLQS